MDTALAASRQLAAFFTRTTRRRPSLPDAAALLHHSPIPTGAPLARGATAGGVGRRPPARGSRGWREVRWGSRSGPRPPRGPQLPRLLAKTSHRLHAGVITFLLCDETRI